MPRLLEIACLQTRPMPDFAAALDEAMPLAEAAIKAGAKFLLLPEYCSGLASEGAALAPPVAPEAAHPFLSAFLDFAAKHKVWVLLGSIAVTGVNGMIINRSVMIDDQGSIRARYDKIHMFDIQVSESEVYRESARVSPGDQAVIVDTPFGRIGLTVCYDLRFPNLYRELAQAGAEIICAPAAFVQKTGEAHWHVLNRCRAIENGAFIISPCAIGNIPGGGASYGHSLVVDPWGKILADGGEQPGMVRASIDLDLVAQTRARIPSLEHDRTYKLAKKPKNRSVA
ncbi:MAG: carbon-nitrogen hydrolase family protein [Rhodobacteraceae bacterium]|nr:carbon-nitrogen hydrolase family protein [Paracoccaceae bacterium]